MTLRMRFTLLFCITGIVSFSFESLAQSPDTNITGDGTLGTNPIQSGNTVTIEGGTKADHNLFHSFDEFSLGFLDFARFIDTVSSPGDPAIQNVISRVTGGNPSNIKGTLRSEIPGANFFFLNPRGIFFSADARVDIDGSFHASTANYLAIGDSQFTLNTSQPLDTGALAVAAPHAFGFLGEAPGPIEVSGAVLDVADFEDPTLGPNTLSLIGGDMRIALGTSSQFPDLGDRFVPRLSAGRINLVSVASPGEVIPDTLATGTPSDLPRQALDVSSFLKLGDIEIRESATFNGDLFARAQNVLIESADRGNVNVDGVDIAARERVRLVRVDLGTEGFGSPLLFTANDIHLDDSVVFTSGFIDFEFGGRRDIVLTGHHDIQLIDSALSTGTQSSDAAGNIVITAGNSLTATGSFLNSQTRSIGNGGNISLLADGDITLQNTGLSSETSSAGDGGTISLSAGGDLTISTDLFPGTITMSARTTGSGHGGDISLLANADITLDNTALSSEASGAGDGGTISLWAGGDLTINHDRMFFGGLLRTTTTGAGDAGNVLIEGKRIVMTEPFGGTGQLISSAAFLGGGGNGGDIVISGGGLGGSLFSFDGSGIQANVTACCDPGDVGGEAGSITIRDFDTVFLNGTLEVSSNPNTGSAGQIRLLGIGSIELQGNLISFADGLPGTTSGGIEIQAGSMVAYDRIISADAGRTSEVEGVIAGDVRIDISDELLLSGFSITTSSTGTNSSPGSIFVRAGTLLLDKTTIEATSNSVGGSGSVNVDAPVIQLANGSVISSSATGEGRAGAVVIGPQTRTLTMSSSTISTSAEKGPPVGSAREGNISISATGLVLLDDGSLVTASVDSGLGGDVSIGNPEAVVVRNGSQILATTANGQGGAISITAQGLFVPEGRVEEVISADAGVGTSGSVTLNTPETNVEGALKPLDAAFQDAGSLLRPSCAARATSGREGSFHVSGAAAQPSTAEGLLLAFDEQGLAQIALAESPEAIPMPAVSAPAPGPGRDPMPAPNDSFEIAMAGVSSTTRGIGFQKVALGAISVLPAPPPDEAAERALSEYRKRAEEAKAGGRPAEAALALSNAARAAVQARHYEQAVTLLGEAKRTVEALEASPTQVYLGIHVGKSYEQLALASPEQRSSGMLAAHAALIQAIQRAQQLDSPRALSFALGNLGSLYQLEHRNDEALVATRRALRAAERAQAPEALYRWHWQEAQLLWDQGQAAPAIASYRRAVDLLEATRQEALARGGASEVYFHQLVAPVYLDLVNALVKSAGRLEGQAGESVLLVEARATMERFKAAELRDYYRDECAADLEAATASLDNILEHAERTAVVYPIVLPDRLELLVSLPGGSIEHYSVAVPAERLESAAGRFRLALQNPAGSDYRALAEELYGWLVKPYAKDLEAAKVTTLVFVPDGALRTVPMAALHDGKRFLVERYAVAVTPGLSLVDPKRLDLSTANLLLAGVSEGDAQLGYSALPKVRDELTAVQALYGGDVLLDADFGNERFAKELAEEKPSVVHLATHAEFTGDPATSFLLTGDGKLTLDDLAGLVAPTQHRQPLELLVLSACETAAGDQRAALGLAGVAIRSGARSAMGSLWSISDDATYQLITHFYGNLKDEGVSKAEALRRAQLALLADTDGGFGHPYYWSPYLMISNWL